MGIRDTVREWILSLLDLSDLNDSATRQRMERIAELRAYYDGAHKEQLKVKPSKFNDNLTINLCRLLVDKSVSALVGDPEDGNGLSWTFPSEEGETTPPSITWLNGIWDTNKKEEWLHRNALQGAETGIPAVKIVPDGLGNIRLINLNPILLTVDVDPQDAEKVSGYTILYSVEDGNQQVQTKEVTEPLPDANTPTSWQVTTYKRRGRGRWIEDGAPVAWLYAFPPILVWQNLPVVDSPYGKSDIDGIIPLQDRYNFLISNLSKIVRLFAHPNRYAKNLSAQMDDKDFKMGPDEMPMFNGDGEIVQLSPGGDLGGAMLFLQSLRESMFALAREVDVQSLKDKVGAITNFALKVLYRDFLDKLGTKRMLYGNAYQELNRRLLILGGYDGEICTLSWPDPLPANEQEEITGIQSDMNLGLVSKQTASEIRGYDWELEQGRMSEEKTTSDNAGALLLQNFFKTGV